MTPNQRIWAGAKSQLNRAVTALGYPSELSDLLAQHLKSPKAMDRMTSYLYSAQPTSVEMIVDEMVAICDNVETWRRKKQGQEAQAGYSAWLGSAERMDMMLSEGEDKAEYDD